MKPKTLISLLTLACLLAAPATAQVNYAVSGDTAYVTSSPSASGNIVIASTYQGKPVTSIGDYAFIRNTSLTSVTIPNSVTSIGERAFSQCTSLTSVTIPNSVTSIGSRAFYYCTSLSAITVDALNPFYSSVDGVLFNKSQTLLIQYPGGKAGSYTIPSSVEFIWDYAFAVSTNVTSVTIPNSVTTIGAYAFRDCYSLASVTIGNGVTSIGQIAFFACTSLASVTIGNSVTRIGDFAFGSCRSLTSVTIPSSVTSIGLAAFTGCTSLSAITVDALNSVYSSVDGVLFNKSQTLLIQYPGGKAGSYTIPNSVRTIDYAAFNACTSLASVTIPSSVTSIGFGAFGGCRSLASVTIPSSVTSIGDYTFAGCTSLTSVTIPNSVTSIGFAAFDRCASLTSVTIGNSVTSIGSSAFSSCTSLTNVYFQGNAPSSVGSDVFTGADNATVYYLPGTTGWGTMFAGRPAVLWNPLVATSDASFGVRTNRFGFTITGANNLVLVVEASASLANPAWTPVGTNTLTGGASYFSDPEWTNHPARFYRLRSP